MAGNLANPAANVLGAANAGAITAGAINADLITEEIAALEREVGERLFDRTSRGVFPTAAGTAFLGRARRALAEILARHLAACRAGRD